MGLWLSETIKQTDQKMSMYLVGWITRVWPWSPSPKIPADLTCWWVELSWPLCTQSVVGSHRGSSPAPQQTLCSPHCCRWFPVPGETHDWAGRKQWKQTNMQNQSIHQSITPSIHPSTTYIYIYTHKTEPSSKVDKPFWCTCCNDGRNTP